MRGGASSISWAFVALDSAVDRIRAVMYPKLDVLKA